MTNQSDYSSRTIELEVTGQRHELMRSSHYTVKVDYSSLSKAMQQISRLGGKITKVTVLSSHLDTAALHQTPLGAEAIAPPAIPETETGEADISVEIESAIAPAAIPQTETAEAHIAEFAEAIAPAAIPETETGEADISVEIDSAIAPAAIPQTETGEADISVEIDSAIADNSAFVDQPDSPTTEPIPPSAGQLVPETDTSIATPAESSPDDSAPSPTKTTAKRTAKGPLSSQSTKSKKTAQSTKSKKGRKSKSNDS